MHKQLLVLKDAPEPLRTLIDSQAGQESIDFYNNICKYNAIFPFTSMGGQIDDSIKDGKPMCFVQNYHQIGSLLPLANNKPAFAQLYVYDTENKIGNGVQCIQKIGM